MQKIFIIHEGGLVRDVYVEGSDNYDVRLIDEDIVEELGYDLDDDVEIDDPFWLEYKENVPLFKQLLADNQLREVRYSNMGPYGKQN